MPMNEYMEKTNKRLDDHDTCLENVVKEVEELKKGHNEVDRWRQEVDLWRKQTDLNYQDIKQSIKEENQKTQVVFTDLIGKLFNLIESKDVRSHDLKKENRKIWLQLIGAGGLIALIVERVLAYLP